MSTPAPDPCPADETLGALLGGALSAAEREAVAVHAAGCAACYALIDGLGLRAVGADDDTGAGDGAAPIRLALRPGDQVGRYTIGARLGAGGMGVVYAAIDGELERQVALKLLRPGRGSRQARERLVREARALAKLAHPNVVAVHDVGEHQGHVYLVMELIDDGDVVAWAARQPRRADAVVACMIDVARGLAAAHAVGLVHRDVKPSNLLVGRDGRVRVADFGLARQDSSGADASDGDDAAPTAEAAGLTRTGTVLGTPAYMAPEVLRGATGPRADQWSYCATLYELLAGVPPFPTEPTTRALAIADGRLTPGRVVPARLRAVIVRGLRAAPEARWPDMSAVATALARARNRRRNLALGALGAVTLIATGGASALAMHDRPARHLPAPPPPTPVMTMVDPRPGCACPLSACTDRCTSVCDASGYHFGSQPLGVNVRGRQEALQGATADGEALLYLTGEDCALEHLWLARRHGDRFVPLDLTAQVVAAGGGVYEGCCSLAPDGAAVLFATADRTRMLQARLAGDRLQPATVLLDLHLPPRGPWDDQRDANQPWLSSPALAHDGRTLYYQIAQMVDGDIGELAGTYQATRADPSASFAAGPHIPGLARNYGYVSGVSSDGRTLFMARDFRTHALVRTELAEPFGQPAPAVGVAQLQGWHAVPLADCQRIVVTYSPGGCRSEDIVYLDAD